MDPRRLALPFALAALLGGCTSEPETGPAPDAEPIPSAPSRAERSDPPPVGETRIDLDGTLRHIWWNQGSMVEELGLTQTQRGAMDELLLEYARPWQEANRRRSAIPEELRQSYRDGDFDRARELAAEYRELVGYLQGGLIELRVNVLDLLTGEQLEQVFEEQPWILNRPWLRTMKIQFVPDGRPRGGGGGAGAE